MKTQSRTVAVVGTGISGLMIALRLCEDGFAVKVYTKGPDPRLHPDAEQYSSTGNGREGLFITGF